MYNSNIFYIDSDENYGRFLLSKLIDRDINVKFMSNIKDTLIEYSYNVPDILICESTLEDGSGFSLIRKIKEQNPDIKTIILTEKNNSKMFLEAIALKVDKVLLKSFSIEQILHEISSLIDQKEIQEDSSETLLFNLGNRYFYEKNGHRIIYENEIIQLTSQENILIDELLKAQGGFIEADHLLKIIGTKGESTIQTLRTVVKRIRKKTYQDIIQNQSKVGYKINFQKEIDLYSKFKINENINLDVKILILKSNKKRGTDLRFQLEKLGCRCENLYTIADAKMILEHEEFDYIISELNLPDGDGIDFIKEIEDRRKTKIIILSQSADIHYKEYLYFKGILDYIVDIADINYLAYNIYKTMHKIESNTEYNNILVIEQSKIICEQIKDILQPRNYHVNIVNDLIQAYELLKDSEFSLVILDLNFQNCFEFISDVRTNINKALPFAVLTDTNRTYETVRDAYKNGANECLRKPIFAEEFILKVDQIVEHYKLMLEISIQKDFLESYKSIVDVSAIVSKTDINGVITYVNSMFCNISGYTKDELLAQNHNIIRHPDTPKEVFEDMWNTIKNKKEIWHGIVKNKRKDGSPYYVKTSIMPLLDIDGNIQEFIALRSDISSVYNEDNILGG